MMENIKREEIEALKNYIWNDYETINQMLTSNCETDIALLSEEIENKKVNISYDRLTVTKNIETIKSIYELMQKVYYSKPQKEEWTLARGTNISEIERLKNELYIDKLLSTTKDNLKAEKEFCSMWSMPAVMYIYGDSNIPYILVDEVLGKQNENQEAIISPFTKIKEIKENRELEIENSQKVLHTYNVWIEKQELEELTEGERKGLYNYIIENADFINARLQDCIKLEKENITNYENIRKLEQLLSKYEANSEKANFDSDMEVDLDDIERIKKELDELKFISSKIFESRKENINFITNWKKNIAVYLMSECREIEKIYEAEIENIQDKTETEAEAENKIIEDKSKDETEIEPKYDKLENENLESIINIVKNECKENIDFSEKLLKDIKNLIARQQNHAKIARNLGSNYSALNNAFEMKKNAETLQESIKTIKLKIDELCLSQEEALLEEKLTDISKINTQIGTLINYLNNPKSILGNSKITRFDEMLIIEENELKRGISETIRNIMGEAELKKLKDDLEIINTKGPIKHLFGMFTGRNKLDEFMLEQIETRQKAVRKTLVRKLSLGHNYSIHEMVAIIRIFVEENNDDELVFDEVSDLEQLEDELKRNFVISDSKIIDIVNRKEGRNLPVYDKKINKKEFIEIETYRFLNKYNYDIEANEEVDVQYQDTMTNEILRIIEYINSSNVLIY